MKRNSRAAWRRDTALYAIIGGLTAAQAYVASSELPKEWAPWIGISLAALVAVKAKLSNGHPDKAEHEEEPEQTRTKPDGF